MDIYLLQCKLLPIATRLAEDKSPHVRLAVASQTDRLMTALGVHWLMVLVDLFQALLGDNDEKVRSEAVYCIPRLIQTILEGKEQETMSSQELQTEVMSTLLQVRTRGELSLRSCEKKERRGEKEGRRKGQAYGGELCMAVNVDHFVASSLFPSFRLRWRNQLQSLSPSLYLHFLLHLQSLFIHHRANKRSLSFSRSRLSLSLSLSSLSLMLFSSD